MSSSTTSASTTESSTVSSTTSSTTSETSSSSSSSSSSTTSSSTETTSSSSSSSSSSTTSSSTTTSSSSRASLSSTTIISTSNGNVVTLTQSVTVGPSRTIAPASSATAAAPKGFFQNTGAVAGVFTVVGLIGLALLILLITTALRRRRARRFDRETEAAAAEAATAPVPVFLDDDEDDNRYGGYGPAAGAMYTGGGYSDVSSHGTHAQQPMSHESYQMSERPGGYDPSNMYAVPAAAGAAGIGVARARSTREPGGYAAALDAGGSPYPAFAQPGYHDAYSQPGYYRGPGSHDSHDVPPMPSFGAAAGAGAAGVGAAGLNRGLSQHHSNSAASVPTHHTGQSDVRSNTSYYPGTTATSPSEYSSPPSESYAAHFQPGFNPAAHQPTVNPYNAGTPKALSTEDAYGGYDTSDNVYATSAEPKATSPALPNPFAADRGMSDDESDGDEPKVLRVANH